MGDFHIGLVHHCVLQRCINLRVTEKHLHLFNRHPLINCSCRKRSTKLMRIDTLDCKAFPNVTQTNLHSADFQSLMGRV